MAFRKGLGAGGLEHLSSSLSCAGCQFHSVFCLGTFLKPNNHYVFILSVLIHWQNFTFYRFVHFFYLHEYLPTSKYITTCVSGCHGGQKCVSDLLGLELQAIMRGHMDSGNQACVLCKSSKHCFTIEPSLQLQKSISKGSSLKMRCFQKNSIQEIDSQKT